MWEFYFAIYPFIVRVTFQCSSLRMLITLTL